MHELAWVFAGIATGVLLAALLGGYLWLVADPFELTVARTGAPAVHVQPLPMPTGSEIRLARARRLYAQGELRAALALLEAGEVDERHAASVNELRTTIQRQLLAAGRERAGFPASDGADAGAELRSRRRPPGGRDEMPEVPVHQLRERRSLPQLRLRVLTGRRQRPDRHRREDCPRRAGILAADATGRSPRSTRRSIRPLNAASAGLSRPPTFHCSPIGWPTIRRRWSRLPQCPARRSPSGRRRRFGRGPSRRCLKSCRSISEVDDDDEQQGPAAFGVTPESLPSVAAAARCRESHAAHDRRCHRRAHPRLDLDGGGRAHAACLRAHPRAVAHAAPGADAGVPDAALRRLFRALHRGWRADDRQDGRPHSRRQCSRRDPGPRVVQDRVVRTVACLGSVLALGAGFLLAVINEDRCAFHDRVADTRVVPA